MELQERLNRCGSLLPVVLLSAAVEFRVVVRAMQNGAVTVLEKPYDPRDLLAAICAGIDRNRDLYKARQRQVDRWKLET